MVKIMPHKNPKKLSESQQLALKTLTRATTNLIKQYKDDGHIIDYPAIENEFHFTANEIKHFSSMRVDGLDNNLMQLADEHLVKHDVDDNDVNHYWLLNIKQRLNRANEIHH